VDYDLDLLGDPIPPGHGLRGRPPHMVTVEKRRLVVQLLAFDWTLERIAAALSITPPTLRKNYFRELRVRAEARARVEGKLINALMNKADAGDVTAIDKYLKRLDRHDLAQMGRASAKAERLGKKETARRDAHTAADSTSWSETLQ
jgi:hypothetical protein